MEPKEAVDGSILHNGKLSAIIVPNLGDMQYRNNPFKRFPHSSTHNKLSEKTFFDNRAIPSAEHYTDNVSYKKQNTYPNSASKDIKKIELQETLHEQEEDNSKSKKGMEEFKEMNEKDVYKAELTKEIEQNFNIMKCLKLGSIEEVKFKEVKLDNNGNYERLSDKTLILDLDGTLIYMLNPSYDYSAIGLYHNKAKKIIYKDNASSTECSVEIIIRPYAIQLLEELSRIYEIIVLFVSYLLDIYIISADVCECCNKVVRSA